MEDVPEPVNIPAEVASESVEVAEKRSRLNKALIGLSREGVGHPDDDTSIQNAIYNLYEIGEYNLAGELVALNLDASLQVVVHGDGGEANLFKFAHKGNHAAKMYKNFGVRSLCDEKYRPVGEALLKIHDAYYQDAKITEEITESHTFKNSLQKVKVEFADFSFMTLEDRIATIENVKTEIRAKLASL